MSGQTDTLCAERIKDALRLVVDPELGYNIVDLGLVYDVSVEGGSRVKIVMTTTTRGCPATDYLTDGVSRAAGAVPGIEGVDVALTYDPPWQPQMMSPAAKRHLGIADDGRW